MHYEDLLPLLKIYKISSMQDLRDYVEGLCRGNAPSNVFGGDNEI